MEISIEVPQKTKTDLTSDLTISFFGIYPKCKSVQKRDSCMFMFLAQLHNSHILEITVMPNNRQ
jgi:hypothetical protein